MDIRIQAAIISAIIAISVAIVSLIIAYKREKAIVERFEKEQSRDLALRIYDRRMDTYPEAFAITERLDRSKGLTLDDRLKMFKEARVKLAEWHGKGPALQMSAKSIKTYYLLVHSIGKQPTKSDHYSEIQLEKIRKCRSAFRLSLREDVGILHDSADQDS